MATIFYDKNDNLVNHHDLQDKLYWCADGESKEQAFVRRYGNALSYAINPQKKNNPFAPDLVSTQTAVITDIKSQHSPFFKVGEFYNIDPTYAVVFNLKDRFRYERYYPEIDILYYIDWIALKADINDKPYKVAPLLGVYKCSFRKFLKVLQNAPIHTYGQRRNDAQGNARQSYVIDIHNSVFEKLM